jgi:hypothetical protein
LPQQYCRFLWIVHPGGGIRRSKRIRDHPLHSDVGFSRIPSLGILRGLSSHTESTTPSATHSHFPPFPLPIDDTEKCFILKMFHILAASDPASVYPFSPRNAMEWDN